MAGTDGRNIGPDILHGVIDGESRCHYSTRGIDVDRYILGGVLGLEKKKLCGNHAGHRIIDRAHQEDDAFLQKAGINVVSPFAPIGLFDHHGDKALHRGFVIFAHRS